MRDISRILLQNQEHWTHRSIARNEIIQVWFTNISNFITFEFVIYIYLHVLYIYMLNISMCTCTVHVMISYLSFMYNKYFVQHIQGSYWLVNNKIIFL